MKSTYTPSNDSDDLNPKYLLNGVATELIIALAKGQISIEELAKAELRNRNLDSNGKWINKK